MLIFTQGSLAENISRQMLRVSKQREGSKIRIFVENLEAAQVTGTFELALVNMKGSTAFPFTATFQPRQKVEAFSLCPLREDLDWSYTLTNFYTLGSHNAVHDDTYIYSLPYGAGQTYPVSQGYNGTFSHSGEEQYAIDWKMPVQTPVLAARAGTVAAIKKDSNEGGPNREWECNANYVLIQHADGTIANYAHLKHQGVTVKVGQWVETGTVIGLSGNTGFSSGPHLHFSVFKTKNGKGRESIPVKFRTESHGVTMLTSGESYRAPKTLLASTVSAARRDANGSAN